MCKEDGNYAPSDQAKWLGRRGSMGDTHSFRAFLAKTKGQRLQDHLARHHRGFNPKAT